MTIRRWQVRGIIAGGTIAINSFPGTVEVSSRLFVVHGQLQDRLRHAKGQKRKKRNRERLRIDTGTDTTEKEVKKFTWRAIGKHPRRRQGSVRLRRPAIAKKFPLVPRICYFLKAQVRIAQIKCANGGGKWARSALGADAARRRQLRRR